MFKIAITLLFTSLILISCGGGTDDEPLTVDSLVSKWSFDEYDYVGGISSGGNSITFEDVPFGVLVISTVEDQSNGVFSGSGLSISYPLRGAGNYQIVSPDEIGEFLSDESTEKVLTISCTIGSASVNATRYEALSGGQILVEVDSGGNYKFNTASSIPVGKPLDLEGGVPDRPDSGNLIIEDAFNFTEN